MHSREFELQRLARAPVAYSLEWWACAQVTRVQSPSAECLFFLNCVSLYDFIFKLMDFTNFSLNFMKYYNYTPISHYKYVY